MKCLPLSCLIGILAVAGCGTPGGKPADPPPEPFSPPLSAKNLGYVLASLAAFLDAPGGLEAGEEGVSAKWWVLQDGGLWNEPVMVSLPDGSHLQARIARGGVLLVSGHETPGLRWVAIDAPEKGVHRVVVGSEPGGPGDFAEFTVSQSGGRVVAGNVMIACAF